MCEKFVYACKKNLPVRQKRTIMDKECEKLPRRLGRNKEGICNMKKKVCMILAMVLTVAFTLTGCGQSGAIDGKAVVATLDDSVEMPLGELNLMFRYEQAQTEAMYAAFGSSNIYAQEIGDGTLYGDLFRDNLVEEFEKMYILEAEAANYGVELTEEEKAAITEAAKEFMKANSDKTKKILGVSQEIVEHVLTLQTIESKMYAVLTADVDTVVTDEEAAQKTIQYTFQSNQKASDDDTTTTEMSDEEKAELVADLEAMIASAKESGDFDAAAEELGLYVTDASYGKDSTAPIELVRNAADELAEGEYSEVLETETGYYVVHLVSEFDEDATETQKTVIVNQRKDDAFEAEYAVMAEKHTFVVEEELAASLGIDRVYTLAQ